MTKQPSHSGERPMADSTPDSGEKPFDPSHFGKHEFPLGLREELIKAEKPRIDPKFLQDTVPPNRNPVLTEPEQPATTPRGGFAAPKPQAPVDRDAPTLIAAPIAKSPELLAPDAPTLVKVPTARARRPAITKAADSPSAPPVDTSRTDPTILLPGVRTKNNRGLVIAIVTGLVLLFAIGLLVRPGTQPETAPAAPAKVATTPPPTNESAAVAAPPAVTTTHEPAVTAAPSAPSAEGAPAQPTDTHKDKSRPPKASPKTTEPKVSPPALSKPAPAPNAAGKQPWIDGL